MIANDDSRVIIKLETSHTDDTRVVIYNRHMFIVQATGGQSSNLYLNVANFFNTSVNYTSVAASDSCFPAFVLNMCLICAVLLQTRLTLTLSKAPLKGST
jgi:hypothetical protein